MSPATEAPATPRHPTPGPPLWPTTATRNCSPSPPALSASARAQRPDAKPPPPFQGRRVGLRRLGCLTPPHTWTKPDIRILAGQAPTSNAISPA
jgi:hypothetical protein